MRAGAGVDALNWWDKDGRQGWAFHQSCFACDLEPMEGQGLQNCKLYPNALQVIKYLLINILTNNLLYRSAKTKRACPRFSVEVRSVDRRKAKILGIPEWKWNFHESTHCSVNILGGFTNRETNESTSLFSVTIVKQ